MKTADFDYNLPEELIAQEPAAQRDECRLLVMNRQTGEVEDRIFRDIKEYLRPGDLIIANETRVLPARLLGTKRGTGGAAEVFLLKDVTLENATTSNASAYWEVLVKPGRRLKAGAVVDFCDENGAVVLSAEIVDFIQHGGEDNKGQRLAHLTTPLPSRLLHQI